MKPTELVIKNIVHIVNKYKLIGGNLETHPKLTIILQELKPFMKNVNRILKLMIKLRKGRNY